jgi:hypothetical protein
MDLYGRQVVGPPVMVGLQLELYDGESAGDVPVEELRHADGPQASTPTRSVHCKPAQACAHCVRHIRHIYVIYTYKRRRTLPGMHHRSHGRARFDGWGCVCGTTEITARSFCERQSPEAAAAVTARALGGTRHVANFCHPSHTHTVVLHTVLSQANQPGPR